MLDAIKLFRIPKKGSLKNFTGTQKFWVAWQQITGEDQHKKMPSDAEGKNKVLWAHHEDSERGWYGYSFTDDQKYTPPLAKKQVNVRFYMEKKKNKKVSSKDIINSHIHSDPE